MTTHPAEAVWLRCKLSPGMFDNEVGVDGRQFDGSVYSLFAPEDASDHGDHPLQSAAGGWIRVGVVERKGDLVLVELPRQTFQNGAYITVKADQLQTRPVKQPG